MIRESSHSTGRWIDDVTHTLLRICMLKLKGDICQKHKDDSDFDPGRETICGNYVSVSASISSCPLHVTLTSLHLESSSARPMSGVVQGTGNANFTVFRCLRYYDKKVRIKK